LWGAKTNNFFFQQGSPTAAKMEFTCRQNPPLSLSETTTNTEDDSASRTKTIEENPTSNPSIQKISEAVASALLASDVTQTSSIVSVALFSSIASSPVLGFNIGRQQAMSNFALKSLNGDCRGLLPSTTVKDFETTLSNPLGAADSPTQMSIGGENKLMSYYAGAVIGNFILTLGLVLLSQGIGTIIMIYFKKKNNNNNKNNNKLSNFGKMVVNRIGLDQNKNNKNSKNEKESFFSSMRRVFATSYVSLTLFFCLSFLMTPILSSGLIVLVAAMNDKNLSGHEVSAGLKAVCAILGISFCIVAIVFVGWSVLIRRQRKEKFKEMSDQEKNKMGLLEKLFKAEGEWKNSNAEEKQKMELHYHNFLIAEPTFESYRNTTWFALVEIVTAILIALPPFFAQFVDSAKGSCILQGVLLLIILVVYCGCCGCNQFS
jgi:hypothetical protein